MVRSVAQRRVSNHEAKVPQQAATHGPASFETRFFEALLRMRKETA
jgi:hypothetical protein